MAGRINIILLYSLLLLSLNLHAQQNRTSQDSLVRLVEASSAKLQEIDGVSYRKVIGPARFLHNNTYLLCDTALWNVNTNIIKAIGHVQIIQENTSLTSDKIDYIVDENLAQFRGSLVELFDKEGNVLRTNYLDYNTKDSIATFYSGGAMRNTDGNLIESRNGEYRSADKTFSFMGNVQMFTDSVFIISDKIDYNTVLNKAYLGKRTTAWQADNMLYANDGEFDRPENIFHFKKDSYILTKEQELWADTLSYFRNTGVARLHDNIQILDTVQSSYCFADEAVYNPEPMKIELMKKPSVAMYTVENGVRDTMFLAADTLKYYTVRYCDIDSSIIAGAMQRKKLSDIDPLGKIESEAAANRQQKENAANSPFVNGPRHTLENRNITDTTSLQQNEITDAPENNMDVGIDSATTANIATAQDSLTIAKPSAEAEVVKDTTAITFIDAWHNVKVFKNDIQALCDSMVYTGIDSMARLYVEPVMWNNVKHQFTSDSMQVVFKNSVLDRANLISNAFIASQEDSVHFNQIKGAEMIAYFKDNDIYRYDALGGASMIFYIQEDSVITIMNQKEGKIISARIKDREIQRIKYVENLQNNAFPVYNLPIEDQRLRGFIWRAEERPVSRFDVTDRTIRKSQRERMQSIVFPDYPYTAIYFAQTRDSILRYKAESDSLRFAAELTKEREQQQNSEVEKRDSLLMAARESNSLPADSLSDNNTYIQTDTSSATALTLSPELIDLIKREKECSAKADSLKAQLLTKEEIDALPKGEKKKVKKEQGFLKKEIRKEEKLQKRLRKRITKKSKL